MMVNINNLVSLTEANQDFAKVARLVDENGAAIILDNNVPRYPMFAPNDEVSKISENLINSNLEAYKELAK